LDHGLIIAATSDFRSEEQRRRGQQTGTATPTRSERTTPTGSSTGDTSPADSPRQIQHDATHSPAPAEQDGRGSMKHRVNKHCRLRLPVKSAARSARRVCSFGIAEFEIARGEISPVLDSPPTPLVDRGDDAERGDEDRRHAGQALRHHPTDDAIIGTTRIIGAGIDCRIEKILENWLTLIKADG
jgi:hypothetical protein